MESLKFSIIVPAYNAEKYLRECLDSLSRQSYEGFEVIIIDDGSTDQTSDICSKYADKDAKFRVIKKKNGGVSSARNLGLENANGEWVLFLDSDDILLPSSLEFLGKSIDDNPSSVMHIWGWQEFSDEGRTREMFFSDLSSQVSVRDIRKRLFKGDPYMGYVWNKAFKRDLIGHIRFAEDIKYNEDRLFVFEYLTELLLNNGVTCVNERLYQYRVHNDSAMSQFESVLSYDLLTDLEAFQRMAVIAKKRGETELLYMISHCAWCNIMGMRNHLKGVDDGMVVKFNELSSVLLSLSPFYMRCIWNGRHFAGRILRRLGLRKRR